MEIIKPLMSPLIVGVIVTVIGIVISTMFVRTNRKRSLREERKVGDVEKIKEALAPIFASSTPDSIKKIEDIQEMTNHWFETCRRVSFNTPLSKELVDTGGAISKYVNNYIQMLNAYIEDKKMNKHDLEAQRKLSNKKIEDILQTYDI